MLGFVNTVDNFLYIHFKRLNFENGLIEVLEFSSIH